MTYLRYEYTIIAQALATMDAEFLERCKFYFGGGTAIVLAHGEYRLSRDVDFLCADLDGYRELRAAALARGAQAFFGKDVEAVRPFRPDQYGLRSIVSLRGQAIKFEVIREARIPLDGAIDSELQVPVLGQVDQFAEKLLANADRYGDRSVGCRDAIDLGYLVIGNGAIPSASIAKAEAVYGTDIRRKVEAVIRMLSSSEEIRRTAETLQMCHAGVFKALAALRTAALSAWPDIDLPAAAAPGDRSNP